ncbi:hypothetical protein [Parvularcula lutaonensis]|uniref:Uncharacterized protein n=1 Tax=Parvularcula lutaonensis TaxID=491923 RepID=A0ABV7MEA6_9PROT|nr:hypothetical protein [Parvularcula lutaonensis]GGY51385.1 hypothetical protein GCM10007148_20330 [Parvularcula lutaonensis]
MFDEKSFEDLMLSGLVVSSRMWRVASGHPGSSRELERMVTEKVKAATEGYWGLAAGLMTGDAKSWQDPAGKFAEPGRKTLRKNAKRLAGYGK